MRLTLPLPARWERMSLSNFRKCSNLSWNSQGVSTGICLRPCNFVVAYAKMSNVSAQLPGVDWLQST